MTFEDFHRDHPKGTCLLARDNENNRKLFPNGPFGDAEIDEVVCEDGKCPHYNYHEDQPENSAIDTPIHMLVAAFRDRLCARTLHYAFSKAVNPKRIFIRIIDQTEPGSDLVDDEGCWPRYCSEYNPNCKEFEDQVRGVRVDSGKSKGPTWARSKLSAMVHWDYVHRDMPHEIELEPVQLSDFCMQTDSHMDFSDGFDQGLIAMHHRTENDYAVLSTYVADLEQNNQDPKTVPHLCQVTFTSSIRNWGTKDCRGLQRPKLTNAMWGAGLSFHRCHGEINVPVDPYTDNVFDGEEGSRGIRFFTHGYDVYTPDKVLVTHDYHGHQSNPVVHTWGRGDKKHKEGDDQGDGGKAVTFEDNWKWMADIEADREKWRTKGGKRVNMLLSIGSYFNATKKESDEVDMLRRSRYGLGDKRTMEQVREFTGINLVEEKMEVNRCGNLLWVPYEESMNYGVDETLSRALYPDTAVASNPGDISQKLRSLSKNENAASPPDAKTGMASATADQGINYGVAGILLLLVVLIASVIAKGVGKKEQRHND